MAFFIPESDDRSAKIPRESLKGITLLEVRGKRNNDGAIFVALCCIELPFKPDAGILALTDLPVLIDEVAGLVGIWALN